MSDPAGKTRLLPKTAAEIHKGWEYQEIWPTIFRPLSAEIYIQIPQTEYQITRNIRSPDFISPGNLTT